MPKFLLIDDNRDNLITLKAVLNDALPGCELSTALNGPQGIGLARTEDPDAILLDIIMPGMDGFEVCRALKAEEGVRDIPVIFLTSMGTDRDCRVKALAAGAEGFLTKPPNEQELVAQLRAMVKVKGANRLRRLERDELSALVASRTRALKTELEERMRVEEKLRRQTAVTASINHLLQGALQAASVEEVASIGLAEAKRLTGSEFGWISELNSAGRLETIASSGPRNCPDMPTPPMLVQGIFERLVRDGTSVLINEPGAPSDWGELPPGLDFPTALLAVALTQDGRTIGLVALGNNPSGYGPEALEAVEVLSVAFATALQRKHVEADRRNLQKQLRVSQKLEASAAWQVALRTTSTTC